MAPLAMGRSPARSGGSFRVPGIRHWLGKRGEIGQKAPRPAGVRRARQRPSGGSMTGQFNMRPEFFEAVSTNCRSRAFL